MKRIIKFQAENSIRWFDTEEECLAYEAKRRIIDRWDASNVPHGIDEDDFEEILNVLAESVEDLKLLLRFK